MLIHILRSSLWLSLFIPGTSSAQKADLPLAAFKKGIESKEVQILDVRTQAEYNSGHLQHALLADWTQQQVFWERIKSLDKERPVYTYCLSGGRSSAAAAQLRREGFKEVYNMKGGMMAWKAAQLPVEGIAVVQAIEMDEYLSKIPRDKTVLVDIGAAWCPPCRKMEPVINEIAKEKGPAVMLINIDGGVQEKLAAALNATEFPTFIIYKNRKEVWRQTGVISKEALLLQLN